MIAGAPLTREQIVAHQEEQKRFLATTSGRLLQLFENRLAVAWQADCNGNVSYERMNKLWAEVNEVRDELVEYLKARP